MFEDLFPDKHKNIIKTQKKKTNYFFMLLYSKG